VGIARVERDVTGKVRIELHLVGILGVVERSLGGGQVLAGVIAIAAAGRDAGLRTFPAKEPQMLVRVVKVGLVGGGGVTLLVPLVGTVRVASFEIDAGEFVANLGRAGRVALGPARVENPGFEFRSLEGVALEGIRHGHRA
jgi:xanthine/CO dehydrogenase XdhC/CoxF family maturation factor